MSGSSPTTATMKICTDCNESKHLDNFSLKNKRTGARNSKCKKCHNIYVNKHYHKNKEKYIERNKQHRENIKNKIIKYKEETPCMDCNQKYPSYVMDFDHRDPNSKIDNVASLIHVGATNKIFEEIKKCDLVCANCHRIRTHSNK